MKKNHDIIDGLQYVGNLAGMQGAVQLENESYVVEFCGYFPADNTR